MTPTIIGACLGLLGRLLGQEPLNGSNAGVRFSWRNDRIWRRSRLGKPEVDGERRIGAWKSLCKSSDERWFEKNPIDYASHRMLGLRN